jgi:hypothetical protein
MIIVDIETTGIDPIKNSMVSIGAVDYNTGEEFYRECRVFDGTEIDPYALKINGLTVEQCNDKSKEIPTAAWNVLTQ